MLYTIQVDGLKIE